MHRRIMEIAADRRGTADEVLCDLLAESTARVPLTQVQHERWKAAAEEAGVTLEQFIKLRVEAGIHHTDSKMIEHTFYTVRALAQHHGVRPNSGVSPTPPDPQA